MINKSNWSETKDNFTAWWEHKDIGRPILWLVADNGSEVNNKNNDKMSAEQKTLDPCFRIKEHRAGAERSVFMAESYPHVDVNIGPGSYATYLGSEPVITDSTVWYKPCIDDYDTFDLKYDENNHWLKKHLEIVKKAHELADGEMLIHMPDLVENIDILSAMRDPQTLLYDMIDVPEKVKEYIRYIDAHYMKVYDLFYNIIKGLEGGTAFTCFRVWGPGKTAKVQCDFSAMISPSHFREFVVPTLSEQCEKLDYTIFHLDGPDCICHVPALMEIENLGALQWTPGPEQPDGANPKWYNIYRQVRDAGKSLWVDISDGDFDDWVRSAKNFINEFGRQGVYFLLPRMSKSQAEKILDMSYSW